MASLSEALELSGVIARASSFEAALQNARVSKEVLEVAWMEKAHHDSLMHDSALASEVREKLNMLSDRMGDCVHLLAPGAPNDIVLPAPVPRTLTVLIGLDILHQLLDDGNADVRRYSIGKEGVCTTFSATPFHLVRSATMIATIDEMVEEMLGRWSSISDDGKEEGMRACAHLFVQCIYAYWLPLYTSGRISTQPGWIAYSNSVFERLSQMYSPSHSRMGHLMTIGFVNHSSTINGQKQTK